MHSVLRRPIFNRLSSLSRPNKVFSQSFSITMVRGDPFQPAKRVAGQKQDVWTIVNEAATASPVQPIINMGQGFFGYNPPQFVIDAAKEALDRVDCNQYSPTKVRMDMVVMYSLLRR